MTTEPTTTDAGLLERGAVLFDGVSRELVVATGGDRVRFLHGIVTADVAGTPVGAGRRSVLLTPKGHVVADMRLFVRPDAIWLLVDAGQGQGLADALNRYAIMDDFAAAPSPDFSMVALLGPEAPRRLAALGVTQTGSVDGPGPAAGPDPGALVAHADVPFAEGMLWLARVRELGAPGFWIGGPQAVVTAARDRLLAEGTPRLAPEVGEAARIAALEPRFGAEVTADYFPMEVGLSGAIDYSKGCYLGQEPIVRIRDRGHLNWRLVSLELAGGAAAARDDRLETEAKPKAGRITSVARWPDGRGVALGMLHVSVPVGATVTVAHGDERLQAQVRAEAPAPPTRG